MWPMVHATICTIKGKVHYRPQMLAPVTIQQYYLPPVDLIRRRGLRLAPL